MIMLLLLINEHVTYLLHLSVRLHISKTTWPNFTELSVHVACGRA